MQVAQTGGGTGAELQTGGQGETRLLPRDRTKPGQTRSDHIRRDSNALCGLKCGEDAMWVLILSVCRWASISLSIQGDGPCGLKVTCFYIIRSRMMGEIGFGPLDL